VGACDLLLSVAKVEHQAGLSRALQLEGIARHNASFAILDITGVRVVDTQVAAALVRSAQAARLLGAKVILTGISPEIAQTLVHIGAELREIIALSSLQQGIAYTLAQR